MKTANKGTLGAELNKNQAGVPGDGRDNSISMLLSGAWSTLGNVSLPKYL
jgi:hypothetical protein